MTSLREEIKNCLTLTPPAADGSVTASAVFPAAFTGFQGHFPGKPVLPGVCLVQTVVVLAEQARGAACRVQEIVSAKFFLPVLPDTPVELHAGGAEEAAGTFLFKAQITGGGKKMAELALRLTAVDAAGDRQEKTP